MSREKISFNKYGLLIKRIIIPIAIAAVIIAGAIFIVNSGIGQSGKVISYGADSKTAFRIYDGGFIQYTKDGANYYGGSGSKTWSDTYTMTTPVSVERGDYTAVFEAGGRNVRVYNESGLVYNVQTSDTIASVTLAENGYLGVITNGESYMVSVYNASGNMLFQRIEADSGVYPLCCDISPKGNIIAISYMDTSGISIKSKIGMFYINADEGADYTDSMFSAVSKDDEIVFEMYFVSDSVLIAIGDRHITCISSAGVEESSVEVTNEITGVALCGNKVALAYGEAMPDKDGQETGTIMFVSSSGNLTTGYSIGSEVDYFVASKGGVVAGSGTSYYGIDSGGGLKWNLNTSGNVTGIYPTSNVKVCVYATRTWAVKENMSGFDTMEYDPNLIKTTNDTSTTEESQVETVADPIEGGTSDGTAAGDGTDGTAAAGGTDSTGTETENGTEGETASGAADTSGTSGTSDGDSTSAQDSQGGQSGDTGSAAQAGE